MSELVPMSIKGLMLDPVSNSPIVVLKDEEEKFFLPIWVGIFEANAIALQLENVETPRPMTHDLLKSAISQLDGRVTRIVIHDLRDSTFFAQIRMMVNRAASDPMLELDPRPTAAIALALLPQVSKKGNRAGSDTMLELDARPSDAIALALRTEAPIYVAQSVLDQAQTITPDAEDQEEKTKKWFENLDTEDLGKYKM